MKDLSTFDRLLILVMVWLLLGGGIPSIGPSQKATAATYVYEKDDTAIPSQVLLALDKLNRREPPILATPFEEDTLDGNNQTPAQYQVAVKAARDAGLPSLVVQAGDKVLKVVKAPTTEAQVMEAVP